MPVATIEDSSSAGSHYYTFLVTAHTTDPGIFSVSAADSGYSVDNLSPIRPGGIIVSLLPGPSVKLDWDPPTDPDVKYYHIYRSTLPGFSPDPGSLVGSSQTMTYMDMSPVEGTSYYRIVAEDLHENMSLPSEEVTATLTISREFGYAKNWNIVSIPLLVSNYEKAELFPTAMSNAYSYSGGYVVNDTLANGIAYWVKFSSPQTVEFEGLQHLEDTIDVAEGWNLVGSLDVSLPISSIGSIPGGIVTSNFYAYSGSYEISPTIEPGMGYWVKSAQAGKLILSAWGTIPSPSKIKLEIEDEQPPPPPGDEMYSSTVPDNFSLEQNYPNPFNPLTSIRYALPERSHVRVQVYNLLGEVIATLVDDEKDAGIWSIDWDAAGVPNGVYYYMLTSVNFTQTKKMLLMK
jgi:hypothetical protein